MISVKRVSESQSCNVKSMQISLLGADYELLLVNTVLLASGNRLNFLAGTFQRVTPRTMVTNTYDHQEMLLVPYICTFQ